MPCPHPVPVRLSSETLFAAILVLAVSWSLVACGAEILSQQERETAAAAALELTHRACLDEAETPPERRICDGARELSAAALAKHQREQ